MNPLKSAIARIVLAVLLGVVAIAPAASAAPQTSTFQILLDEDNHQNTGCDVAALTGTFKGVEQILITTVTAGGPVTQVTAVQVRSCVSGTTFGAPVAVPAPAGHPLPWNIGVGNGTGGTEVIETYLPLSLMTVSPLHVVQVGVLAFDNGGVLRDELLTKKPQGNAPILLNAALALTDIPTLSEWGLMLLGLMLAGAATAVLRRRRTASSVVFALLLLGSAGLAWGVIACDLDGNTTAEWTTSVNNPDLATDAVPDSPVAPVGTDIRELFGAKDNTLNALVFRIDADLPAPVFNVTPVVDPATFSVPENSANGTSVGTVTFTDPDVGQTHTFAITAGNTAGAFAINPATGQITVANSAALDFEVTPIFNLTVQVTDNGSPAASGSATVTVNLTDVNEAPVVDPATFAVPEGSPNGTSVGTVTFTDPDMGQNHTCSITAGNTGGAFAINPLTCQITVADSTQINFATTPTYSLTVQVTDDGTPNLSGTATVTVNVTDVNDAPVVDPATFTLAENSPNGTNVGTPVTFTDPDVGQTHTFAITAGNTGGAFAINASTGQITVATVSAVDFETNPTFNLTVQVTDNGSPVLSGSATITINLTDVNEAPVVDPATFSLPENSPNGTNVGTPITFTDQDTGQTHTFSITAGNTGGAFTINASTGQITVATASAVDFETNPTFNLTVQVTDNGTPAQSGTATVTINLTNVNEAPVVNPATFSVAEHAANGTNVGTPVNFTDPDAGQTHTFAIIAGNTSGAFAINASTGQITVANSAAVDFATNPTFSLTAQVTDNGTPALSGTATVTINVADVNDPPVVNPATFSIPENSPNGTNAGIPVTFSDPDTGQTHTFSITAGNTGGAFAINASTGQITVANSAALDFETTPAFNLTVQVTDNGTPAQSGTATVTINLTDVNEAPVVNPATFSIPENSPNGTNAGVPITFTDQDTGQAHAFSITAGNTGGAFTINASTGQISVANSAAVDFETNPTFMLTVQVTDNGTPALSGAATVTINLSNVNEMPVVNPATFAVNENSPNGTSVGTVTFTDPDTGQTHTFSITAGNAGGAFAINPSTGVITVANSAALDFEVTPTFTLTVQVTDNGTPVLSSTATVTINLNNLNEAPVVNPATFALDENSANGTTVGTVTFADSDVGQTHTFSITAGNTGGAFTINPSTGVITVANSAAVDFETTPTFTLTVQVTDNGTPALSGTATIIVNLNNLNDPPVVNPATFSLNENSPNGTTVGTVTFADGEPGQTHTFSITAGNTGAAFAIDPSTGVITVATSAALDFETTPTFTLTVQVTDNGTPVQSGSATITINLLDLNEAPVVSPATFMLNENSPNGTNVGTVTFTDPDTGQTHTFAITAGNTSGAFAINPSTGVITVANVGAVNFEVNPTFSLTVQVTDNGTPVLSGTATITINLIDLPEPPTANPDSYDTIGNTLLQVAALETATGPHIFVTGSVLANDTDQDVPSNLTVSLNTASPGAVVTLNTDGTFTYLPPPGAAGPTDTFTYNLTDGTYTVTGTVTINLRNRVWFVKNNATAGGLGRSADPFDTLAEAQTASSANDYIFVFLGDGTSTGQSAGITLKNGQHLLGEHIGLSIPIPSGTFNGAAAPLNVGLVTAVPGNRPLIDNTAAGGNAVSATDAIPAEVKGFSLSGNTNAIDLTTNAAFAGSGTFSIQNNVIRSAGAEGIDVNLAGTGTVTLGITGNSWNAAGTHTGNAVDINRTGGVLQLDFSNNTGILSAATAVNINGGAIASSTITGFANNTVHQNTGGTGISVANVKFDSATGSAAYDVVSGGSTVVGVSGNGVGGAGVVLTNVSGDLSFTDLDIFADGGAGLRITGTGAVNTVAGTGTQVAVGAGVAIFEAIGGPAVDVTNATINLQPSSIKSTNSSSTGVSLDTVFGTFAAGSGSSISGATGTSFNVNAGTATISYDGTITNSTGRSVSVTSKTSGSTTFNGTITATGGTGIFLNSNTGSTIGFTKQISLSTGANDAFTATGGGTVTTTDTTSTLTTTTGVALNVANTTIGAGGLKFANVSAGTAASGPSSGIVLNNTGASGGLTVNGGTIQKTTSHGVSLTSTLSPAFNAVTIKNTTGSGVKGTTVTNFSFTNGTIDTVGTGVDDSNIAFNTSAVGTENNVSGTVTITGNTLTNAFYHGVDIQNFSGTLSSVTVSSNTITSSTVAASSNGSGIRLIANGSATTASTVSGATINGNVITNFPSGSGIRVQGGNGNAAGPSVTLGVPGNAGSIINITNNRVAGASAANKIGLEGILATVSGVGQGNFNVSNNGTIANPLANITGTAISINALGSATVTATADTNVMAPNNTFAANGIAAGVNNVFGITDAPSLTVTITNNNISSVDGNGILAVARNSNGTLRAKIQNNIVAAPLTGVRPGIRVDSGTASGNTTVCLNMSGNTSAGSGGSQGLGLRKQGTVTTTNAFGVNGMAATSTPGVEAFVDGLNPSGNGTLLISATSGFSNCSLP